MQQRKVKELEAAAYGYSVTISKTRQELSVGVALFTPDGTFYVWKKGYWNFPHEIPRWSRLMYPSIEKSPFCEREMIVGGKATHYDKGTKILGYTLYFVDESLPDNCEEALKHDGWGRPLN
ncbi:MAG: hypothetical protein NTZ80_03255 [Patescibacteria group bacterium]|nr:hypothetical protein [Patescibacteria group bacterium]